MSSEIDPAIAAALRAREARDSQSQRAAAEQALYQARLESLHVLSPRAQDMIRQTIRRTKATKVKLPVVRGGSVKLTWLCRGWVLTTHLFDVMDYDSQSMGTREAPSVALRDNGELRYRNHPMTVGDWETAVGSDDRLAELLATIL